MQPSHRRSHAVLATLAACALTAVVLPALARKGPKPQPCDAARYLVAGAPIVAGDDGAVLALGSLTAIEGVCTPARAKPWRANRKGFTQLRAHWKACDGLTGGVTLQGKIVDGCARFEGTLRARKLKRAIAATLSQCGDGVLDDGGGEECDDGNATPGDGCEPTCVLTPASTTTTIATGTTSTSTTAPGVTTTTTPGSTGTTQPGVTTTTAAGATTTTTTLPRTDLRLAMVASADPVGRGELLTYVLAVTNRGPVPALDAVLRLPVPSGMFGSSGCQAVSDGGTFPGGCAVARDVTWNLGQLDVGTTRTVQVTFLTTTNAGVIPDGATISAGAEVRDLAGSEAAAATHVLVEEGAPLTLGLAADADPVPVGGVIEYVASVGNRGASAQLSTQLSVTLAPGLALLDAGGGAVAGSVVTWDLAALEGHATAERRVRVQVTDLGSADPLTRLTRARLASTTDETRASALTALGAAPLGLVMTAAPEPAAASDVLTYELTVTNRRATAASDVQLSLPVPAGMFGSSGCLAISDDGAFPGGCAAGRDSSWALGQLAGGESRTVRVTFATTTGASLPDGSIVSATARARDAAGGSARAAVDVVVRTAASLALALTGDADPVSAGDQLEYVLRFGNRGGTAQLDAILTATLPAGTMPLATDGGTVSGSTVTWDVGALEGGATGERRLRVQVVGLGASDPLVRRTRAALVSTTASARASVATTLGAAPLGLVGTVTPDPVGRGELLTYELTVTNRRATAATDVQLFVPVPAGMFGSSGCRAVSDGGDFPGGCVVARDVTWSLGSLAAGASRTVHATFVTTTSAAALPDGSIVRGSARARDAAGGSARWAASTLVRDAAPLVVGLTGDADPIAPGAVLEYAIRFGNRGGATQAGTQLAVILPPGTAPLSTDGGTVSGQAVTWNLGNLESGRAGERRLRVTVTGLAADPHVRLARATLTSDAAAATASLVTTLGDAPLGLEMTASPDLVGRGEVLTYELTVTNRRPTNAVDVQVLMPVPAGMFGSSGCQAISDAGTLPGGCVAGQDAAWALGQLAPGASRTVRVAFVTTTTVTALPDGSIVSGTARAQDAADGSVRSGASTGVRAANPLMLGLAASADPVAAGDQLEYVLRFGNRGATSQSGVKLVATLPPGTTAVDTDGGTVDGAAVTWDLGVVTAGTSGSRSLRVSVTDLGLADTHVRRVRADLVGTASEAHASVVVTVGATPLGLTLTASPDPVGRSAQLTYVLTVTNNRATSALDVQVLIPVPTGMFGSSGCQAISDSGTFPGGCVAGRDATWNLGQLAAGASRDVHVTFNTTNSAAVLPNGSVLVAAGRVRDAAGGSARAGRSVAVAQ